RQLGRGAPGFWFGRVDGWWLVDISDRLSHEEPLRDEFGKAQRQHGHAVEARGKAQEQIGNHAGDDLEADGVLIRTEELADVEMLLDPAEQEFDLPARFVERCDLDRGAGEVVSDQGHDPALIALDLDPAQRDGEARISLADELDLGILDDREAVADL